MEKSQFHLVVQKVDVLRSPYVGVSGIVEGGSISVNDRVRVHSAEGNSPKPEVDIPWTQFRSITFVRKKKKSRLILTMAERSITLRSEVLSYRWGDFVDFARRMAEEYRLPFNERWEKK